MTVEHRLLFGVGDICCVSFECLKCAVRLSVQPKSLDVEKLQTCPACGVRWLSGDTNRDLVSLNPLARFVSSIPGAIWNERPEQNGVGVRIVLEFNYPKA